MTIAYLTNSFPEPVESYVWEEIEELEKRGVQVIPCSVWHPKQTSPILANLASKTQYVFPLQAVRCLSAIVLIGVRFFRVRDLLWHILCGPESTAQKLRALAHTGIGAYLASLIQTKRVRHIHVHHGYFSAWVGMVAARLLSCGFSMTLHGSDLLLKSSYLDTKLANCSFCFTVSDFNRKFLLEKYPAINPDKILLRRLGVDPSLWQQQKSTAPTHKKFSILTVGRLHAVKDHSFLLLACRALKDSGTEFRCTIAGEGEERPKLEQIIRQLGLADQVRLLGHVQRENLPALYAEADVFVLTSHSEGLPIALMEAMAMERIVIAPRITGLPEIVEDGVSGFLYPPDDLEQFLARLKLVAYSGQMLDRTRTAARAQIELNFNGPENLAHFAERFLRLIEQEPISDNIVATETHEDSLLQQI